MGAQDWVAYRRSLEAEIASWGRGGVREDDPWSVAIGRIPRYFDGLVALAGSPELDDRQRRVVHRVIKYLVSPLDLMPEFIYGPVGFREDITLVALAAAEMERALGREVVARAELDSEGEGLRTALARADTDLDPDVLAHLRLLLEADSVAGDEELAAEDAPLASAAMEPARGAHTIVFAGPGTGKTYRLEQELERLLVDEGVAPDQVLVTAFTNRAADELHAAGRVAGPAALFLAEPVRRPGMTSMGARFSSRSKPRSVPGTARTGPIARELHSTPLLLQLRPMPRLRLCAACDERTVWRVGRR